jgi:hypothetical protein
MTDLESLQTEMGYQIPAPPGPEEARREQEQAAEFERIMRELKVQKIRYE